MTVSESSYAARFRLPDIVQQAVATTLECPVYLDDALVTPTAAGSTCTVYDPGGAVYSTGAIVNPVVGSTAQYALAAVPSTKPLGTGWKVEWSLIMGATGTYVFQNPMVVVLRKLYPVLTDLDLTSGRYSDLAQALPPGTTTFSAWRVTAWEQIQRELLQLQRRPWLITEPSAFMDVHRDLTYSLLFRALGQHQRGGDRSWLDLAQFHADAYRLGMKTLSFDYASEVQGGTVRMPARPVLTLCATGVPRQ